MTSFDREQYLEIAPNKMWTKSIPFRFLGLEIGVRMTVVRLEQNNLLVYSPIALDPRTRAFLADLGQVKYIVAPNMLHHLYLSEYVAAYPNVKFYAAPGLPEKRKDIKFNAVLTDTPEEAWQGHLEQMIFTHPELREVIFFHPTSKTLIVADLIMNFGKQSAFMTRMLAKLSGDLGEPTCNLNFDLSNSELYQIKLCLERILTWDFEIIVISHGEIITKDAKAVFRKVFNFLLETK
jgi:hypothetical protein